MKPWVDCGEPQQRMNFELTDEIKACMERYFFHHYCEWFGEGSFAKTIAQIPMVNMLDDHDLIDGFGTVSERDRKFSRRLRRRLTICALLPIVPRRSDECSSLQSRWPSGLQVLLPLPADD